MTDFSFSARILGLFGVNASLRAVQRGVQKALGGGRLEKFLLERTKARFRPRPGMDPNAQRSPDGYPWRKLAESTVRRRKRNRDALHKLYDTGTLARSISVLKGGKKVRPGGTGEFQIGVSPASPAIKYYLLHQQGGINSEGKKVPKRPFLGISKQDLKSLGDIIKTTIEKEL